MSPSLLRRLFRRCAAATITAAAVGLPIVAAAAGFTLAAPAPAAVTVGAKGMVTFHMTMTSPNGGTAAPSGLMTVIRQGDTDPIWCFPNAGTLCYTGSIVNGTIDVHVSMSKLAATTGTLLFQLRDPNSKAPYSNALPVPVRANVFAGGSHVIKPTHAGPINKVVVPSAKMSLVPAASPKP